MEFNAGDRQAGNSDCLAPGGVSSVIGGRVEQGSVVDLALASLDLVHNLE
jgi:hypothetical protein